VRRILRHGLIPGTFVSLANQRTFRCRQYRNSDIIR
jgi:hypothetical protein